VAEDLLMKEMLPWSMPAALRKVAAYHPENSNHQLRIPENAKPWDSGMLMGAYPGANSTLEQTAFMIIIVPLTNVRVW
jgi:hypothetical protein